MGPGERSRRPELSFSGVAPAAGDAVPVVGRPGPRSAGLVSPAARKAIRQRMLLLRSATVDRLARLTGASPTEIQRFHRELRESDLPETLVARGADLGFVRELPQGSLLYLMVRAARPRTIVETGVGPGYSTAWILAAVERNGEGQLTSLGPGSPHGRPTVDGHTSVGQFVAPALRGRWTLALGNSEERLREILAGAHGGVDLFFYDNGPEAARARFELRSAWDALSERGYLLAHHVDATGAWADLCRLQGVPPQVLDAGPPPLGALGVRARSG